MARIDGGEMLVPVLEAQGLRELFTLPGGHLDAIYALSTRRHNYGSVLFLSRARFSATVPSGEDGVECRGEARTGSSCRDRKSRCCRGAPGNIRCHILLSSGPR